MTRLTLNLFGGFQARFDDQPLINFDCVKTRALLAYIADDPGKPHWRSMLAGLLWPGRNENSALSNLRHSLTCLVHLLNNGEATPPFLLIDRETITFNTLRWCEVDSGEFQKLLQETPEGLKSIQSRLERWEKAVSLFRGNFLEHFKLDDSPEFEDWIMARREYYNSQVLEILFKLSDSYLELGLYKKAEICAQMQINLAPWKEEAYQQVIKALAFQGRRSDALRLFFTCKKQLSNEFGVEPSEESQRLFLLIKAGK
jgi:DNA-binding SARP family transcriptional activator